MNEEITKPVVEAPNPPPKTPEELYVESIVKSWSRSLERILEAERGSQRELSEKTGISYVYLSRLRNGKQTPSLEVMVKICRALGKTLDEMIGEKILGQA